MIAVKAFPTQSGASASIAINLPNGSSEIDESRIVDSGDVSTTVLTHFEDTPHK
jgi:hypothetical protein